MNLCLECQPGRERGKGNSSSRASLGTDARAFDAADAVLPAEEGQGGRKEGVCVM